MNIIWLEKWTLLQEKYLFYLNEIKMELTNGLQNRSESLYLYSIKIYSIVENFLNNLMETFSKIRLKMLILHN